MYIISLESREADTTFDIELTDEELALMKRIEKVSFAHACYSYMPTLSVKENDRYKFKTEIEDEKRLFEDIYDVVDHVEDMTSFGVDSQDLKVRLRDMVKDEILKLRDDCIITCIL